MSSKLFLIYLLLGISVTVQAQVLDRGLGLNTSPRIEFNWQGRLTAALEPESRSLSSPSEPSSSATLEIGRLPMVGSRLPILPRMAEFPVSFSLKVVPLTLTPLKIPDFPTFSSPRIDIRSDFRSMNTSPR